MNEEIFQENNFISTHVLLKNQRKDFNFLLKIDTEYEKKTSLNSKNINSHYINKESVNDYKRNNNDNYKISENSNTIKKTNPSILNSINTLSRSNISNKAPLDYYPTKEEYSIQAKQHSNIGFLF